MPNNFNQPLNEHTGGLVLTMKEGLISEIKTDIDDNELDDDFIEFLRKHKIKSIFEQVFSDVLVVNSYLSILTFANAVRHFPVIRELVYEALKSTIYYLCTLHEEVIKAIALEAATVGSEATSYTTTFMMTGSVLLVWVLSYQGLKYPFSSSQKTAFKKTLAELGLDPTIFSKFSTISSQQIAELTELIQAKISDEKELVKALLAVYFDNLSDEKKLTTFATQIKEHKLKSKISDNLTIKPSRWQSFVANTEWYLTEIGRYRIPIAAVCAIPGLVLMVLKSIDLGGANLSTLLTDTGSVADQANDESLEIYPWIFASGPVICFQSLALFSYLVTRPSYLNKLALGFYNKIHAPIEKWAKDPERWLYYDLGLQLILIPATPGIASYAGIKALDFGERYAKAVGCESVANAFKFIVTNTIDSRGKCLPPTIANLFAAIVGDSEFDKAYSSYALLLVTYYPIMAVLEKYSSLKEKLPRDKAKKIYAELNKINKNSYYFAGGMTFMMAWLAFFIAKQFADNIPQIGLQVAFDLNDYITPNMTIPKGYIDNSTLPTVLNTICPNADLGRIISDALEKFPIPRNTTELQEYISHLNITQLSNGTLPNLPVQFINNSTFLFTVVASAPQYGVMSYFLLNLLGITADSSPLIEYRTLAAFVTLFWMAVSYTGGGSYSTATATQLLGWGIHAIKNWCYGENLHADQEVKKSSEIFEAATENLNAPLLPQPNQSEAKKNRWSNYYNSMYRFFKSELPNSNLNKPIANLEYKPPVIRI